MPLAFRTEPKVPSNKTMAINRLMSLTNMLLETPTGNSENMAFINDLIKNRDGKPVSKSQVHSIHHENYIAH